MNFRGFLAGLSFIMLAILLQTNCKAQELYLVRSAGYWTSPIMSEENATYLAKYSLLIVDGENTVNNPQCLRQIKKINPSIKLILYSNPIELYDPMAYFRPMQTAIAKEIKEKYPQWLLKISNGEPAVFFKNMILLNMSTDCPRINGLSCAEYLAKKELDILKDSIWDGYFMDNGGRNISWVYENQNSKIDANNDHINDIADTLDLKWEKGILKYLSLIRVGMTPNRLLLANKGSLDFMSYLDGRMFENFPNNYLGDKKADGWYKCMENSRKTGLFTIFLVKYKDINFGLASALLTDNVYLAIEQDNAGVHPELNPDLGKPLGGARMINNIYYRLYEKGKVEVFPEERRGNIIKY